MARSRISLGVQNQTEKLLRTGKRWDKFDQIRSRHFWSAYFFKPNAQGYILPGSYTVFTTPVGSNGQGFPSGYTVSERESNWKSQNRVPDNQNFKIQEICCSVMNAPFTYIPVVPAPSTPVNKASDQLRRLAPPMLPGLQTFFQSAVLSISYVTNSVPLGLLADFPQSGGPFMGSSDPDNSNVSINQVLSNGFAAPALRRKFKIPILLQAGESFNFAIEVSRPILVLGDELLVADLQLPPFLLRVDFWANESFAEKS